MKLHFGLCFLILTAISSTSLARPVSYPDGIMVMTMNNHMSNALEMNYSITAYDAFGIKTEYMRTDEAWLHGLTYNHLLQRWNAEDSQANLYLMTGAGVADAQDQHDPFGTIGLEADWETRRYYLAYENRYLATKEVDMNFSQMARVGIAPYIADYDAVHTWLMLQVNHHPEEDENIVITPLVRVFNTDALGEFGISHKGDVMFNLTLQF